jgi:membrane protein
MPDDDYRSVEQTIRAKNDGLGSVDADRVPKHPGKLGGGSLKDTLKRTWKEFSQDRLTDEAAALTYYGVLSIFPAIIALVSILGLIGPSATNPIRDNVDTLAPGPAKDILIGAIDNVANSRGAAGVAFVIGLLLALNAASGYTGAFSRASNKIYEVEEGRPFWKLKPLQIGITLVLILLLVLVAVGVTVTGGLATEAGKVLGLGDTAVTVWNIAKWPVILALAAGMIAFLYWSAPNVRQPGIAWVTPGGVVALVLWIVASALFAIYVAGFASYNKTYGALGGVVAFLVWMWLTNVALLFGAEFNAELQRTRQIEAGHDAPLDAPFLEPRDTSKLEK